MAFCLVGRSPHGAETQPELLLKVVPRDVSSVEWTRGSIATAALSCCSGCSTASLLARVSADASSSVCTQSAVHPTISGCAQRLRPAHAALLLTPLPGLSVPETHNLTVACQSHDNAGHTGCAGEAIARGAKRPPSDSQWLNQNGRR